MATNKFKNGNLYIIIYSVVMVVVVAVLLSVTALSLKNRQAKEVLKERQKAILQSLGKVDENGKATVDYDTYIVESFAVDAQGNMIACDDVLGLLSDLPKTIKSGKYPVFKAQDGSYVFPVTGNGLWDVIWGYVALNDKFDTITGVVFDHKGETPGLGAEIATKKHQQLYVGKKLFKDGKFESVSLVKGGIKPGDPDADYKVDAITGGTKTSDGVTAMLHDCLENYIPFINKTKAEPAVEESEPAAEESEEESAEPETTEVSNN